MLLCCLSELHSVHDPGPKQKQMIPIGNGIDGRRVTFYLFSDRLASCMPPYSSMISSALVLWK